MRTSVRSGGAKAPSTNLLLHYGKQTWPPQQPDHASSTALTAAPAAAVYLYPSRF